MAIPHRQVRIWLALAFVGLTVGAGLIAVSLRREPQPQVTVDKDAPDRQVLQLVRPEPPPADFVGSKVCAECHEEVCNAYAAHPMANSCAPTAQARVIEDYSLDEFSGPDNRKYRVERTDDGRVLHHESLSDAEGELYDQVVEISYVLGSGQHGRAYLREQDGLLFQSPITWYSQQSRWDFSPGYDPKNHQRFERRVGDGCLYCHAGGTAPRPGKQDVYQSPAFTEAAIGCERCHGPAGRHVAFQQGASVDAGQRDPIVNPAKLEPPLRDAVCYSCHLQGRMTAPRFGRGFFDFRPGMAVDDVLLIYVEGERIDGRRRTLPVSQVEQMQSSRCYQESSGRFGCTSCHDPHRAVAKDQKAAYYRQRCLSCHQVDSCSETQTSRNATPTPDSCVDCHMPPLSTRAVAHTSLTDHRVMRKPTVGAPSPPSSDPESLTLFGDEQQLPPRERERGRGLLLLEAAQGLRSGQLASLARGRLIPPTLRSADRETVIAALRPDPTVLDGIAFSYLLTGQPQEAIEFWKAAVEADPHLERGLHYLAQQAEAEGNLQEALARLDQLADCNSAVAEVHARRANVLARLGRTEEAAAAASRALELNPTLPRLHEFRAELYRSAGDEAGYERQRSSARRIRQAQQ